MILLHSPFTIHHYVSISSTNDQLKSMSDAPEFTCVTADKQTAGRGRRDRTWHSALDEGLYLSILLRPEIEANEFPLLSFIAAIAVAETIQPLLENSVIDIKWPNDVLVNEKKICGVLIESASVNKSAPRVIVGIGVNLTHQIFPEELSQTATSLWIESGKTFSREMVRSSLLDRIAHWYETLRTNGGTKILTRWQQLSSYTKGKKITAYLDQEILHGVTDGLSTIGALKIITETGDKREIVAGEITHLRTVA